MHRDPPPPARHPTANPFEEREDAKVLLVHAEGMHARPAVRLSKLAKRFRSRIVVRVAGETRWTDAKSVAKVLAMRAPCDSLIEVQANGADARAAVAALVALIANDFLDAEG